MEHTIKLPIGTFNIYDNYLVATMNEGATVTKDSNRILEDIVTEYYPTKKFVYITHRVNSYAVDPAVYSKTSKIENLVGFAVVANSRLALTNAEIEKLFLKKPFEVFRNLKDAINWAHSILKTQ